MDHERDEFTLGFERIDEGNVWRVTPWPVVEGHSVARCGGSPRVARCGGSRASVTEDAEARVPPIAV